MLVKTKAIVVSKLKYKDADLIVKCYTRDRGIVSFLVHGALRARKGRSLAVYFQMLSQLQFEANYNPNKSLQSLKEPKLYSVYGSLHTNIYKSAIALFLAEILTGVLKEEAQNESLYDFLETTLNFLDYTNDFANFHLLFLLKLTRYLGVYPEVASIEYPFFNLQSGTFELYENGPYSISSNNLILLKSLLGINFDELSTIQINAMQRQEFLSMLLRYFELHLDGFKTPKSLQVLNEVFH